MHSPTFKKKKENKSPKMSFLIFAKSCIQVDMDIQYEYELNMDIQYGTLSRFYRISDHLKYILVISMCYRV